MYVYVCMDECILCVCIGTFVWSIYNIIIIVYVYNIYINTYVYIHIGINIFFTQWLFIT